MRIPRWRTKRRDEDLSDLEDHLQATLFPVEPRPIFVSDLKARLVSVPIIKQSTPPLSRYVLLAAAGLISSIILVITGVRATVTVLGALGILHQIREQVQHKQVVAIPPTA